ncbi:hypothetical protein MIR68_006051 [Amoeboaphelidium protococcarum]|nr:hypothetical protein MIR68_006051 [Amoeboaphelidium protococcarum]
MDRLENLWFLIKSVSVLVLVYLLTHTVGIISRSLVLKQTLNSSGNATKIDQFADKRSTLKNGPPSKKLPQAPSVEGVNAAKEELVAASNDQMSRSKIDTKSPLQSQDSLQSSSSSIASQQRGGSADNIADSDGLLSFKDAGPECLHGIDLSAAVEVRQLEAKFCNISALPRDRNFYHQLSSSLTVLDLSHNHVAVLPDGVGLLRNLRRLHLSHNKLNTLPVGIGSLSDLDLLDVSNNLLFELPQALSNLSNLVFLDISHNKLKTLPPCLGRFNRLLWFFCAKNRWDSQLSGILSILDYQPQLLSSRASVNYLSSSQSQPTSPTKAQSSLQLLPDFGQQMNVFNLARPLKIKRRSAIESTIRLPVSSKRQSTIPVVNARHQSLFVPEARPLSMLSSSFIGSGNEHGSPQSDAGQSQLLSPDGQQSSPQTIYINRVQWMVQNFKDVQTLRSEYLQQDYQVDDEASLAETVPVMQNKSGKMNYKSIMLPPPTYYDTIKRQKMGKQRVNIVKEIVESEQKYVEFLQVVYDLYIQPMQSQLQQQQQLDALSREDLKVLFSNWESLLQMHRDVLLADLTSSPVPNVGQVFLQHSALLKMYSVYVNNYDLACNELTRLQSVKHSQGVSKKKRLYFKEICTAAMKDPRHTQPNLSFYLIMPVQRVPRYKLLLEDLLKNTTSSHPDYKDLHKALAEIRQRAIEINEKKREADNNEKILAIQNRIKGSLSSPLVQPFRKLLNAGQVFYCRYEVYLRSNGAGKSLQQSIKCTPVNKYYLLIMFSDIMLMCKFDGSDSGADCDQDPSLYPEDQGTGHLEVVRVLTFLPSIASAASPTTVKQSQSWLNIFSHLPVNNHQLHQSNSLIFSDNNGSDDKDQMKRSAATTAELVRLQGKQSMDCVGLSGSTVAPFLVMDINDKTACHLRLCDGDRIFYLTHSDQSILEQWIKLIQLTSKIDGAEDGTLL